MDQVLQQFGIDCTFFVEGAIFIVFFFLIAKIYLIPFAELFELRHKKTTEDLDQSKTLASQAKEKMKHYEEKLWLERQEGKAKLAEALIQIKKQYNQQIEEAHDEARRITQQATSLVSQQKVQLMMQLEQEIVPIAQVAQKKLMSHPK